MAKQKGIIKLQGTIGDISFYKTADGHLAREKGGIDGDRIKNDPRFARTRENGKEFGMAARSGKILRDAFRPMMMKASDRRVVSRLTKLMSDIRKLDTTSGRGDRSVAIAIANQPAKDALKDFNFNNRALLKAILFRPYAVDNTTGEVTITDLVPVNHIAAPSGATHIALTAGWGKVNFGDGTFTVEMSPATNLPIDATQSNVTLTPPQTPAGTGTDMFLLMVEFFQEVNGNQYSLNDGLYNALTVIDVA
jgi:hypothetical protein